MCGHAQLRQLHALGVVGTARGLIGNEEMAIADETEHVTSEEANDTVDDVILRADAIYLPVLDGRVAGRRRRLRVQFSQRGDAVLVTVEIATCEHVAERTRTLR